MWNTRILFVVAAVTAATSVNAASISSCRSLVQAYDTIRKTDETLPALFKDASDGDIKSGAPQRVMISGVRDNVGSLQCDKEGNLDQLELDYNGEFLNEEGQKRLALQRFERVAISLVRAFTGEGEQHAKSYFRSVMMPAAKHAHSAILRGDEEPSGEAATKISTNFEIKMRVNHEGPTLFLQHPDFDK